MSFIHQNNSQTDNCPIDMHLQTIHINPSISKFLFQKTRYRSILIRRSFLDLYFCCLQITRRQRKYITQIIVCQLRPGLEPAQGCVKSSSARFELSFKEDAVFRGRKKKWKHEVCIRFDNAAKVAQSLKRGKDEGTRCDKWISGLNEWLNGKQSEREDKSHLPGPWRGCPLNIASPVAAQKQLASPSRGADVRGGVWLCDT